MSVHHEAPVWPQCVFPVLTVGVIFLIRLRRMGQSRPLRLERLWVVPALYLLIVGVSFAALPPTAIGWLCAAVGLALGLAVGWQRGKTMRIEVDPATHRLNQRASPAGMVFLLAVIVLRSLARAEGGALHLNVALVTNALLAFALGMLSATRAEMYLRGKRLLADARQPATSG